MNNTVEEQILFIYKALYYRNTYVVWSINREKITRNSWSFNYSFSLVNLYVDSVTKLVAVPPTHGMAAEQKSPVVSENAGNGAGHISVTTLFI